MTAGERAIVYELWNWLNATEAALCRGLGGGEYNEGYVSGVEGIALLARGKLRGLLGELK